MIYNLYNFKKALASGVEFEFTDHYKKELLGRKYQIKFKKYNGIYFIDPINPENTINHENHDKGLWLDFATAKHWEFRNGIAFRFDGQLRHDDYTFICSIRLLDSRAM